jgi:carotenoid cleavage dioxygenase-like enzyme
MLERWTFNVNEGAPAPVSDGPKPTREQLYHNPCDFPTEDQRFVMSKIRHHWIGCFDPTLGPPPGGMTPMGGPPFNNLVHLDEETNEPKRYFPGLDSSPEEPMFVLKAGPIATLKVPFRLRHAFHCAWISGDDLDESATR